MKGSATRARGPGRSALVGAYFVLMSCAAVAVTPTPATAAAQPSWEVTGTPNPGARGYTRLTDVSCLSQVFCMAVGGYSDAANPTAGHASAERWNGAKWSLVPVASIGNVTAGLLSVSCASPKMCMAVGARGSSSSRETLTERWDGTAWSLVPSPSVGSGDDLLLAVDCPGVASCIAAGSAAGTSLVEVWDGSTWTIVDSPTSGSLSDVSCPSALMCMAVGGQNSVAAAQTWDGTTWTQTSSPSIGTPRHGLSGVSCTSATSCMAVGAAGDPANAYRQYTLIEKWDGQAWSRLPSPNPATNVDGFYNNNLLGVTCVTDAYCAAVGFNTNQGARNDVQLIESWDGVSWSVDRVPVITHSLADVSCVSTTSCAAVGEASSGNLITSKGMPVHRVPGVPTKVVASPANGSATLQWQAPLDHGYPPLTGYVITTYLAGTAQATRTVSSSQKAALMPGLKNGKKYSFRVAGKNSFGTGPRSATSPTIVAGSPRAPAKPTVARTAPGSLKVKFTAPADNGAPITGYTATCSSSNGGASKNRTGTASPITVTALNQGKTYSCTIKATNGRGTSPPSAKSSPLKA